MALAQEPRLLLLDEPTQGLSVEETAQAVETLAALLADGRMTVLPVEHDMEVVFRLAHRITVLHRGAVIADDTPEAVRQDTEVQRAYLYLLNPADRKFVRITPEKLKQMVALTASAMESLRHAIPGAAPWARRAMTPGTVGAPGTESPVRSRLTAGAKRIRTIGPTLQPAEFRKSAQVLPRDDDGRLSRGRSVHGGTGSSNPPPSSGESANPRSHARHPVTPELEAAPVLCAEWSRALARTGGRGEVAPYKFDRSRANDRNQRSNPPAASIGRPRPA
jgi:hypothetical protein